MKNAHKILVAKPEEKRPLEIPRYRWDDDVKMERAWIGFIWFRTGTSDGIL
jgi:hypothetical protein